MDTLNNAVEEKENSQWDDEAAMKALIKYMVDKKYPELRRRGRIVGVQYATDQVRDLTPAQIASYLKKYLVNIKKA